MSLPLLAVTINEAWIKQAPNPTFDKQTANLGCKMQTLQIKGVQ